MKKMFVVLFIVSVVFISCPSSDDDDSNLNASLVGTWNNSSVSLIFKSTNSWEIYILGSLQSMGNSYTFTGTILTIRNAGYVESATCSLSSDGQTITLSGFSAALLNDIYTKQP